MRWVLARPVASMFLLAVALRVVAVVALTVSGLDPNPDERTFWQMGRELAAGETDGWSSYHWAVYENGRLFLLLLAVLDLVPGSSLVVGRLTVAVLGAAAAAAVAWVGARLVSARLGLVAGLVTALWPSQVAFSASALRDPVLWLVLAALGGVAAAAASTTGRRLAGLGVVAGGLLFALLWLRPTTGIVAGLALIIAATVSNPGARAARLTGAVALFVLVPGLAGFGAAGAQLLDPGRVTAVQTHRTEASTEHACTDLGHQATALSVEGAAERFVRAAPASLLGPYPWQEVCSVFGQAAKVEAALFAGLLLLAGVGVASRLLPWRPTAFAVAFLLGMVIFFGLGQDNVGTAFRHRGQVFWVVALFATAGLLYLRDWMSPDTRGGDDGQTGQ